MRPADTRRKHRALFPVLFAALVGLNDDFFAGSALVADDAAQRPIETGEIKLREVLRDTLKVDAERYPFGEIECEITNRHLEGPVYSESARVHSWWLNGNSFTTIQERTTIDPFFIRSNQPVEGIHVEDRSQEQTVNDDKIMIVNHSSTRARIQLLSKQHRMLNTSVTPADFWFGKIDGQGKDWYRVLGPSPETPVSNVKQYDTQLLPGERLLIKIMLQGDLGSARAVASLRHWKILSVDAKLKHKGKDQRFTHLYTWSEDGKVLKRLVYRMKAEEQPLFERLYEVKKLDVVNKPNASRFEIDETKLPSGYIIGNRLTKPPVLQR